ncbi:glycosyltransferase family 2 protein [Intestinibacter bartlettii]|uniref:glycosyltransferase family 2 protein n=1 Tax=Intestinibacter bartlettii TaxID=261299 RepID=UPI001106983F|nr:glycosyltransferase [Intestinibacter bartlettii]
MGLSVIIPVYNGEKYIEDCLNSIINQTYKDLQIIVVNDGSTDNTKFILSGISKSDSRIQVINKENTGVCSARNVGLEYATKNYVTFVDSDDTLDLDMYELLMQYSIDEDYDIVHCGYKRINDENVKLVSGTNNIIKQTKNEALECIVGGKIFVPSLWNKVYKRKLFDDIKFDENLKINEDVLINYKVFKKSEKSIFIDKPKYNYFEREESSCKNTNSIKKAEDCLKVAKIISEDCKNTNLEQIAINRYIESLIGLYRSYFNKQREYHSNSKEIKKQIYKCYKNKLIKIKKQKISAVLIIYFPFIYKFIYEIYDKIRVPNWDV